MDFDDSVPSSLSGLPQCQVVFIQQFFYLFVHFYARCKGDIFFVPAFVNDAHRDLCSIRYTRDDGCTANSFDCQEVLLAQNQIQKRRFTCICFTFNAKMYHISITVFKYQYIWNYLNSIRCNLYCIFGVYEKMIITKPSTILFGLSVKSLCEYRQGSRSTIYTLMPHATILSFIVLIYYRIKEWFSSINLRVISVL